MHRFSVYVAFLTLLAVLATACTGQPTPVVSHGGSVTDYISLIDNLRAAGATVIFAEAEIQQPFLSVTGQVIGVNGQNVQVFEYPNEDVAAADAAQISEDGSTAGTTMITWVAAPHFYRAGKLIVIYIGENESMLEILEGVLGPQFAGR